MGSIQTSVASGPDIGLEGQIADSGDKDVVSGLSSTRKLVSVAVTASNSSTYTVTINGTAHLITADGSATTAEITAALVSAINSGAQAAVVTAVGTDTPFTIEADVPTDFTTSYASSTGALAETVLVPHGQQLTYGKLVVLDERVATYTGAEDYPIRSPRLAADITGGRALGVSMRGFDTEQVPASLSTYPDSVAYLDAQAVHNVLREGRILVKVEQAVLRGDAAYARFASGSGGSLLGAFRKDSDSTTAALVPGCKFLTSAASGALAVLSVNRP